MFRKYLLVFILFLFSSVVLPSQEALKSAEEDYYDFLALQGLTERPALNYRTLSDSVWSIDEDTHLWQDQNFGTWYHLFGDFRMRVYGPELFMSGNTAAPYGQNDGVLWQGRGFNALLKGGVRFEGYGIELTLLPHFAFSQNAEFDYIQPNYSGANYKDKAEEYGYYGVKSIDAPQRFGDKPFFDWDFGDSEIRYSWKTLTIGFGTQAIWLGPAQLNPIIHSNNAPSYPKLDVGLRRQPITLPWLGWYIGDIEFRAWWGYLSESDWFDNIDSNDHNLITGISVAYSFPSFLKGLTIGFNRIMLSKWDEMNFGSVFTLLWPFLDSNAGFDENDQRMSVTINYILPIAGINIYLEWGRNDYSNNLETVIRYPFHTEGYTFGIRKTIPISTILAGEIMLELTNLECSQDYDKMVGKGSTFYAHHKITQGHTNRGQWLAAGIGTGGNSQHLGFKLYYPRGFGQIFIQRRNPDLDYSWYVDPEKSGYQRWLNIRATMDYGLSGMFYITKDLSVSCSFIFRDEFNPFNVSVDGSEDSVRRFNAYISIGIKCIL